jgi:carboxyl-terminal processing protease
MPTPFCLPLPRRLRATVAPVLLVVLLAACGGDDNDGPTAVAPPASCSTADQKDWLVRYLDQAYFWYRQAPRPDPAGFSDLDTFFEARLYAGSDPTFPADRWSGWTSTESYQRFYGDGASMGYGVAVAGLELERDGSRPLWVRYVEPASPAAAQGVARGDQVLAINGRAAGEIVAADDFSALTATTEGQVLTLRLARGGVERTVTLTAGVFTLAPVQGVQVTTTPGGRKLGYLMVKDMIAQAQPGFDAAFARFRSEGVQEIVLDLRYNGGGLVSTGTRLASYFVGTGNAGRTYAQLRYSDRASASNQRFVFDSVAASTLRPRVLVLAGRRTCSASEQVVNGLRGVGVEVELIGEATCGKPVGFVPVQACTRSWSIVNFESVNERGEGRYWDGFEPTCAVAEDFQSPVNASTDALFAAAVARADGAACPALAEGRAQPLAAAARRTRQAFRTDERQDMIPR